MASTYDTSPPPPAAVRTESRYDRPDHVEVHRDGRDDNRFSELHRRVSWGAIFAGSVVGISLLLLFTLLGVGVGSATLDPAPGGDGSPGLASLATSSGIWLVVTQLFALLIGGIVAAKLAGSPDKGDSALHGMAVWAVATLATFWIATTAVGTVAGGAATILGKAGSGLSSAAEAAIPDDLTFESLIPNIEASDLPPEVQRAVEQRGLTPEQIRTQAEQTLASVVGPQERRRALDIIRGAATDAITNPGDAGAEASSAVDQLFGGPDAVISDEDREQLQGELASRFGVSEQEAQQTLDNWEANARDAVNAAEEQANQLRVDAQQAAEQAASAVSGAAFLAFVASVLGLIAAVIGGLIGRPKDEISDARTAS